MGNVAQDGKGYREMKTLNEILSPADVPGKKYQYVRYSEKMIQGIVDEKSKKLAELLETYSEKPSEALEGLIATLDEGLQEAKEMMKDAVNTDLCNKAGVWFDYAAMYRDLAANKQDEINGLEDLKKIADDEQTKIVDEKIKGAVRFRDALLRKAKNEQDKHELAVMKTILARKTGEAK